MFEYQLFLYYNWWVAFVVFTEFSLVYYKKQTTKYLDKPPLSICCSVIRMLQQESTTKIFLPNRVNSPTLHIPPPRFFIKVHFLSLENIYSPQLMRIAISGLINMCWRCKIWRLSLSDFLRFRLLNAGPDHILSGGCGQLRLKRVRLPCESTVIIILNIAATERSARRENVLKDRLNFIIISYRSANRPKQGWPKTKKPFFHKIYGNIRKKNFFLSKNYKMWSF